MCWKGKPPHEAIAIIAMKRRGPEDNLAAYKEHLSRPKPDEDGRRRRSEASSAAPSPVTNGSKPSMCHPKSAITPPSILRL